MSQGNDEWCDRHDWPLYQCPPECTQGFHGPSEWIAASPPPYEGPRPTGDPILISPTGIAHRLGCSHLPDYEYLAPPKWGWIDNPTLWGRIGAHELRAEVGNTDRVAHRRCDGCDHSN